MNFYDILKICLASLILGPPAFSSALVIPHRSLGFVYKRSDSNRSAVVTLTAFLDFTCHDSQKAFPTLIALADSLEGKNFELVIHPFSLPYHRNSHLITRATHIINKYTEGYRVFPFLTEVFEKLDSLTTSATKNLTDAQVIDVLTPIVIRTTCVSRSNFMKEITNSVYDSEAKLDFKHGCTRGVYETPTFMLNDVVVKATPSWTIKRWMQVISGLL